MIKRPKIAIIGAGGNVGAAVAQWAVQKELGDLVLIDLKEREQNFADILRLIYLGPVGYAKPV